MSSDPITDEFPAPLAAAAIQATGAGMSIADATLADTPLVFVNQAFCRMTGYSAETLLGRNARLLQAPETDPVTVAQLAEALAAGEPISVEILNRRQDGSRFWNHLTIDPIREPPGAGPVRWWVASSFDISERRRLEQALADSERRLQVILDTAADAIITMDSDSRVRDFNAAAEDVFGYRRGEVIGGRLDVLLPADMQAAHDRFVTRYLATGEARIIGSRREVQGLRRDGRPIDLELGVSEVLVGGETLFTGVMRDVTERKRAEAELRQAKAEAEAAARAKAEFLAAMSHEIRTPMNGVLGMADLLLDTPLTPDQRRYARAIANAGTALLTVLNDILDVSKLEAGKVALERIPFNLRQLVDEVVGLLTPQARDKGLGLETAVTALLDRPVLGDPARIRQILLNLAGNAVKFTETGRVLVRVEADVRGDPLVMVRLDVIDTGIGIPRAAQAGLFTRYFRVDGSIARQYGGTGLGLTICQQLAELMGGSISVDSEEGRGSCFTVTLPLRFAAQEAASHPGVEGSVPLPAHTDRIAGSAVTTDPGTASGAVSEGAPMRILLVEDNETNRLFAGTLLERAGYSVETAVTGVEAVRAVAERDFGLVLMDLRMPEMDGFTATERIRALPGPRAHVPIVALTAHAMAEVRAECLARGMDGYIAKPLKRKELLATVAEIREAQATAAAAAAAQSGPPSADGVSVAVEPVPADAAQAGRASARPDGARPFIDGETFAELVDSLPGHAIGRILTSFLDDLTERSTRLRMLHATALLDVPALARAVHDLSSVAGTVGALTVMEEASDLERLCLNNVPHETLRKKLVPLLTNVQAVIAELKDRTTGFSGPAR